MSIDRRHFLAGSAAAAVALGMRVSRGAAALDAAIGDAPPSAGVEVMNPRARVPVAHIIDDSTCLVNMGCFCMPQFAAAWPDRQIYTKPWKTWPREIPDAFVREFGQWCGEHGVKGKYSIVPYPACVGWLDRELPGWSRRELQQSLRLVRELMVPNWDIHPEMITHTRVIDLKTGRPLEPVSAATMENSYPQDPRSVDELAEYIAYALRILRNCELPCEGITTPGGFGNRMKSELSLAVQQAVRDVTGAELPHYFKYVSEGSELPIPRLEHVSGQDSTDLRLTVNVAAGTGDWFGNWDGDSPCEGFRYANEDATRGRMVEMIERGGPAIMLCHWAGLYTQGTKQGFAQFQKVVLALESRFRDQMLWMKLSEIARYWAAKELCHLDRQENQLRLRSPVATSRFTLRVQAAAMKPPQVQTSGPPIPLREVKRQADVDSNTWLDDPQGLILCFDLPRGETRIAV